MKKRKLSKTDTNWCYNKYLNEFQSTTIIIVFPTSILSYLKVHLTATFNLLTILKADNKFNFSMINHKKKSFMN